MDVLAIVLAFLAIILAAAVVNRTNDRIKRARRSPSASEEGVLSFELHRNVRRPKLRGYG